MAGTRNEGGRQRGALALALALAVPTMLIGAVTLTAQADVASPVQGSAYGYRAFNISLFNGTQNDTGPAPTASLAPDASNSPQSGTAGQAIVGYGPATLFTSDDLAVNTSGSLGANGSVTSTSDIKNINKSTKQADKTGSEVFTADRLQGSVTVNQGGVNASVTITNGSYDVHSNEANCSSATATCGGHTHGGSNPTGTTPVPANPAPNTKVAGHVHLDSTSTDYFVIIFNEQITNADGSLTVNPVHEIFGAKLDGSGNVVADPPYGQGGSILHGDLILGQVVAGAKVSAGGGGASTTAPSGGSTTTLPGATTTVAGSGGAGGTTTTVRSGATTTIAGSGGTGSGATTTTLAGGTAGGTSGGTGSAAPNSGTGTGATTTTAAGGGSSGGGSGGSSAGLAGKAIGYWSTGVSLFGGAQPDTGPTPTATLAADGSNSPQDGSAGQGTVKYGPANIFTSDGITVHTEGSKASGGTVKSTSEIKNLNKATTQPDATGSEVFTADSVTGSVTATPSGVTPAVTITSGSFEAHSNAANCSSPTASCGGHTHDGSNPTGVTPVPANPPANYKVQGHVHLSDTSTDYFVIIFNEQITNTDGTMTLNPVHEIFGAKLDGSGNVVADPPYSQGGSILHGDLYVGQVVAGLSASGGAGTGGSGSGGSGGSGGGSSFARTGTEVLRQVAVALDLIVVGWMVTWRSRRKGRVLRVTPPPQI